MADEGAVGFLMRRLKAEQRLGEALQPLAIGDLDAPPEPALDSMTNQGTQPGTLDREPLVEHRVPHRQPLQEIALVERRHLLELAAHRGARQSLHLQSVDPQGADIERHPKPVGVEQRQSGRGERPARLLDTLAEAGLGVGALAPEQSRKPAAVDDASGRQRKMRDHRPGLDAAGRCVHALRGPEAERSEQVKVCRWRRWLPHSILCSIAFNSLSRCAQ